MCTEAGELELSRISKAESVGLIWRAYEAEGPTMVELYSAACSLIRNVSELSSPRDQHLLEELGWQVEREREAHT